MGAALTVIATSEKEEEQGEVEIVQRKTETPADKPETSVVEEELEPIVPLPETSVHIPVPETGMFAESVVEEAQID